jgi:hypothetical protein
MERHHTTWDSIVAVLKVAMPLIKAVETGNDEHAVRAAFNAIKDWDHIEFGIEKVSEQIHLLEEFISHNHHEKFTGSWKASDTKKNDLLIQRGNHIIYYPYSDKGYGSTIYIGQIISRDSFCVMGTNSKGEKVMISGYANGSFDLLNCTYFSINYQGNVNSSDYYLGKN